MFPSHDQASAKFIKHSPLTFCDIMVIPVEPLELSVNAEPAVALVIPIPTLDAGKNTSLPNGFS